MPLAEGSKLGPYEIISLTGAGGMGEVYKARDTRLARIVAVKVLPAQLTANADIKQRFEREAKAISSLNHPNICILHDIVWAADVSSAPRMFLKAGSKPKVCQPRNIVPGAPQLAVG